MVRAQLEHKVACVPGAHTHSMKREGGKEGGLDGRELAQPTAQQASASPAHHAPAEEVCLPLTAPPRETGPVCTPPLTPQQCPQQQQPYLHKQHHDCSPPADAQQLALRHLAR